jgi:glucose/arabinose dehydrogenase
MDIVGSPFRGLLTVVASAVLFAASAGSPPFAAASEPPADLTLTLFKSGFTRPVAVRHAGDGTGRLFIVEQGGTIRIIENGQTLVPAFLDLSTVVDDTDNEQGLLGLAFHLDYENNGFFYVNYTYDPGAAPDRTRVARYQVSAGDANLADPGSATTILDFQQNGSNHNGGDLHFGPDGYLYIAVGDGGGSEDPDDLAQDKGTLLGKMLRIDVDAAAPYAIPADNPFVADGTALDEIWAYGLRNPWRFSFDRLTGDLFIGDVGQYDVEEIDFQAASSTGGENYGWSCMEGDAAPNYNACDSSPLTAPILVYDHGPECSVTGGYLYRGNIGGLHGRYVFGDYCSGEIWSAAPSGESWTAAPWADTALRISAFGEDETGELYVVDLVGGSIFRFESPSAVFTDLFESGDASRWTSAVGD